MSVAIQTLNIGGVDNKMIVLNNGSMARVMSIGTTWTRLRIWCRRSFDDLGATPSNYPRFYFGLMSNPAAGMTNGPLTTNCSHFVGYRSPDTAWNRSTGPARYGGTLQNGLAKKVGNTVTTSTGWASTSGFTPAVNTTLQPIWIEFTKAAPNLSVTAWATDDAALPTMSFGDMESLAERRDPVVSRAVWNNNAGGTFSIVIGTALNIAVDEGADGPLNAICVGWDRTFNCYISELQYSVMA